METLATIRRMTKTLLPLGVNLGVAALVIVMAFATVGITFQPCQCSTCACCQDAKSCCCSKTPNSCCDCENSDCGCEGSDCGCSCTFCMCGIGVESTSLPRINDSVNPMVFMTTISQTSPKPFLTASFWTDQSAVASQTRLYASHCRWLI